ncbi:MAG TPA: 2'-5' RNA ligase family protein [Candidatus Paceibacterota bacterium]|nr:2'-5' RNA ligase family protein [Candidatus Paceibacterota bacterium]
METKRLFIGLVIDQKLTDAIMQETISLEGGLWRITPASNLHITVIFLGDVLEGIIPDVKTIVENIASRTRPFALTGGRTRIMQPDEPTMLWMRYERNSWFERLVADAESCFKRIGTWERQLDRKHRKTRGGDRYAIPHITLARVRGGGMLDSLLPPIESSRATELFMARKIALFSSQYDKKTEAAHYEKLGEWDLED